jgi:hypothetical protein
MFRYFNGLLAVAALAGIGWILSLPNKAECMRSGRVVDPTERHCESSVGFEQLQEHALFHSREVVLAAGLVWVGAYLLHRRQVRRSRAGSPTL